MPANRDLALTVRTALAGTSSIREVRMFGGTAFMLRGNLLVAASPRGLLVRVGKDGHADALARVGARPMVMKGRAMEGYVYADPALLTARSLKGWLTLALGFVGTLPAKAWAVPKPRAKAPAKAARQRKPK